ncbi:YgfZ/GcvT domain-containing protein [Marinomonas algarum]|uniref:Aminomethyltransferase folate-binding domain-containing protein n=1 Tax=Marinomonas algarum TaxID=2883105 RepID=A0A9X1IK33_9GAMM|nr:hypothetical protein [Marinomonas algarum]
MSALHRFVNSILQDKTVVTKQTNLGVIRIAGDDGKKFLQGQMTCDLNTLTTEAGLYGAICSVKGRIISNFVLVQHADDVLMLLSADLVEKTLSHLKKYAVFFKAQLNDASEEFTFYRQMSSSPSETAEQGATLSTQQDETGIVVTLCHQPFTEQWHLVSHSDTSMIEQHPELADIALLTARPLIQLKHSEQLLPQWLNMQANHGISFTKGCYTGQEIVARMQYRGKSPKHLALITWEGELDISQALCNEEGKSIGQVFDHGSVQGQQMAQVILNIDASDTTPLTLDNTLVQQLPLPYSLETKTTRN